MYANAGKRPRGKHFDKVGTRDEKKGHLGLTSDILLLAGLTGAGGPTANVHAESVHPASEIWMGLSEYNFLGLPSFASSQPATSANVTGLVDSSSSLAFDCKTEGPAFLPPPPFVA
jgi:hypothetical protein